MPQLVQIQIQIYARSIDTINVTYDSYTYIEYVIIHW